MPSPKLEATSESTGTSSCSAPEVPILTIFKTFFSDFMRLVSKFILTNASISFNTISILSQPIPVEIAVILLPLKLPVCDTNSLFSVFDSMVEKKLLIKFTLPGSPTNIMISASCEAIS